MKVHLSKRERDSFLKVCFLICWYLRQEEETGQLFSRQVLSFRDYVLLHERQDLLSLLLLTLKEVWVNDDQN